MASWYDKTLMVWTELAEDDRLHVGNTSAPDTSKDRTMTRADARRALQCEVVSQTAHGLAVLDPVRHNGTAYVRATADTAANAVVAGVVVSVPNADTFIVQYGADVVDQAGLTAGSVYYLQDAGGLGTTAGTIAVPILVATSATTGRLVPLAPSVQTKPYDLVLGFVGVPSAASLDWILIARACTVAAASPGEAYAITNPSADWTLTIRKNSVSIGTVTISTAGAVTWSVASDVSFAAGDRVELVSPDPADSTGADVQVALRARVS